MPETQNIEYKSSWRDEFLREICGFANAQGGTLYIGKDDNGELKVQSSKFKVQGVEIFDIYGRKQSNVSRVTSNELINISHLNSDLYFVKITTEAGEVMKKVIKL